MILWDLIERHIEGPGQSAPIDAKLIPNGDPLPASTEHTFWVRTMIAKSEDELKPYLPQILRRKC